MLKNAIIITLLGVGLLVVLATLGGTVPVEAQRRATVEVRVWQSLQNSERLYISARPEGGSWATLGTRRLLLDDGHSSDRRFRYGNISLEVPLVNQAAAATVELRVWQRISDPRLVYLSARPAGGRWGSTERLPMDETNERKTFRYSDRTVAVPLPEATSDVPTTFWGDFSEERQTEIRDEAHSVVMYFADLYGLVEPDFELHVSADDASLAQARREVLGISDSSFLWCGEAVDKRVFILEWCATRTAGNRFPLAGEYFQVLQARLASSGSASASVVAADWLLEGTAHYMGIEYAVAKSHFQRKTIDSALLDKATSAAFDLRKAEADVWDGGGPYVAAFATAYLVQQTSAEQVLDFFRALPRTSDWREAFSQAFGMSTEAFYADLASHVDSQRTQLFQVVVRVLNPDGSRLDSAVITASTGAAGVRQDRGVDLQSRSFNFSLPEGNYRFRIHATNCLAFGPGAAIAQMIARHPSEGRVEIHGDLEILVQLPDWPSELNINCSQRDRYAIRGTLVSTGDHDFTTYSLSASTPGLWGSIYLDGSGAEFRPDASGAFEILVPDGYEYRIELQNKCREGVGWYVSGRDVVPWDREQATGVAVDGTDVTGIRILLPEVIPADERCNQR